MPQEVDAPTVVAQGKHIRNRYITCGSASYLKRSHDVAYDAPKLPPFLLRWVHLGYRSILCDDAPTNPFIQSMHTCAVFRCKRGSIIVSGPFRSVTPTRPGAAVSPSTAGGGRFCNGSGGSKSPT